MAAPADLVLHVAARDAWEAATETGVYPVPGPEAFTHLCTPSQLAGVVDRYFPPPHDELVLLRIDPAGLPIVVEPAADGAGDFPHLYGELPVAAVVEVVPLADALLG